MTTKKNQLGSSSFCQDVYSSGTDTLSAQGIRKYLNDDLRNISIEVTPLAASTIALAREKAELGADEGYTVIANEQSAGRGRLGRGFFSPPDTGIYMSVLLRPINRPSSQAIRITTAAAAAMCEAIESVSNEKALIKWVNDIFIRGKKVCGILTEASFGTESMSLKHAILGIGINIYPPKHGFPKELENIAGFVFSEPQNDIKNRLTAQFLNHFMSYYTTLDSLDYVEKYRQRSLVTGKRITVISPNGSRSATALGTDDDCRLHVIYDDGSEELLSSGEISIRL